MEDSRRFLKGKTLFYIALAFSIVVIWLCVPLFKSAIEGEPYVGEDTWYPALLLGLFPISAFTLIFVAVKGKKYKKFSLMFGILLTTLAYEFLVSPWSVEWSLRSSPHSLSSLIVYLLIGTGFVILATFFFKRGVEQ